MQIRNFRLSRASATDLRWMKDLLNKESMGADVQGREHAIVLHGK